MKQPMTNQAGLEKKLTLTLYQKAAAIDIPMDISRTAEQLFENQFVVGYEQHQNSVTLPLNPNHRKRTLAIIAQRIKYRLRWRTAALVMSIMIVLSGGTYASNMVYSIMTGEVMLTFANQNGYSITPEQTIKYREMSEDVLSQLQPGQRAYVYSSRLSQFGFESVIILNKPKQYDSVNQLQKSLPSSIPIFPKPLDIPADYQFKYGTDTSWIDDNIFYVGESKIRMLRGLLQNKLTHPTANCAWMQVPLQDEENLAKPVILPRLIYTSSEGHTLSITFSNLNDIINNQIDMIAPQQTNASLIQSSKGKMIYTSVEHSYIDLTYQTGLSTVHTLIWSEKARKMVPYGLLPCPVMIQICHRQTWFV